MNIINSSKNIILEEITSQLSSSDIISISGSVDIEICDFSSSSKECKIGTLFIAIKGETVDGHLFIEDAIKKGAKAIICEDLPSILQKEITYILVHSTRSVVSLIAKIFFNDPSKELTLIGVTGTNGKTSIVTFLYTLFMQMGLGSGLISTVIYKVLETDYSAPNTTPDTISLNRLLREMVSKGCKYCFMEVSSHSTVLGRIDGLTFAGGVFTNITHDHLDFHKSFKNYISAKQDFFAMLPPSAFAITNLDDKNGLVMLERCTAKKITYSLKSNSDYKFKIIDFDLNGTHISYNGTDIFTRLIGEFNIYNLLAVFTLGRVLEIDTVELLRVISSLTSVRGRFETIYSKERNIMCVVDYAHTPDALKNVLETLRATAGANSKIVTVVGCGGDRDKIKRPIMGKIATNLSDFAVFTSDNPRREEPSAIINDMNADLTTSEKAKRFEVLNREEAIKLALSLAREGDSVLIAGKGHEAYQEINGVRTSFDDALVVKKLL